MDLISKKDEIEKKLHELGYELVSFKSENQNKEKIIRLVIDRIKPIGMDDIVSVSNKLNEFIDTIDDSSSSYTLDISSLGAEKPLKIENLKDYKNAYVNIHLNNPIDGNNIFEGTLKDVNDEEIIFTYRKKSQLKEICIKKNNIYKIRLAIKF